MTPKEKAKQLFEKFESFTPTKYYVLEFGGNDDDYKKITSEAKQCCLIAVDELVNLESKILGYEKPYTSEYWEEVKKEIKNL